MYFKGCSASATQPLGAALGTFEVLLILPSKRKFGSKDLNLFGNLFGRRTFINFITIQTTKGKSIDFEQGKIFLLIMA